MKNLLLPGFALSFIIAVVLAACAGVPKKTDGFGSSPDGTCDCPAETRPAR